MFTGFKGFIGLVGKVKSFGVGASVSTLYPLEFRMNLSPVNP